MLGLQALVALSVPTCSLTIEQGPNTALPAFQDLGFALPLTLELCPQQLVAPLDAMAAVCRDCRVGMEDHRQTSMRLGVVMIGKTKDAVQEGPMPVTENMQHA